MAVGCQGYNLGVEQRSKIMNRNKQQVTVFVLAVFNRQVSHSAYYNYTLMP